MYRYIKDPAEITAESFKLIAQLVDLSHLNENIQPLALRLIHTSGQLDIIDKLEFTGAVMEQGIAALRQSAPVLCDVEMVKHGLSKKYLTSEPLCFLNRSGVAAEAKRLGITRSMCALTHWGSYLTDAIVVIGNAPTALFKYLEMLQQGAEKPALIIGMPVGFVGAAESKQALLDYASENNIASVTLKGRVGGSALAAAAFNAIAMSAKKQASYDGHA